MSNKRESKLWKEIGWLRFLLAIAATIILGGIYFMIWQWSTSVWRDILLNVTANLIPVPLVFILAYIVFRRIEELRSEKETDELADKVILRLIEIAKIQENASSENNNYLRAPIKFSESYLKLSREFNVVVKPFDAKSNPQKIVVGCIYRGTSSIHVKRITYHGLKLSIKDDISDMYKLDGLSALISEDKIDLLSGGECTVDLILAKKATKWNKTIESWYGELGYLFFEIEFGNEIVNLQKAI